MSDQKKETTNPIAKLVQHFVMDPIKTPKEADARIKELLPFLGGFLAGVILFLLLGMWVASVKVLFDILAFVCMLGVFAFGFFMFRAIKTKSRLKKLQCESCNEIIAYSGFLGYSIITDNLQMLDSKIQNKNGCYDVSVKAVERKTFNMQCKCQNCGTEKRFSELFVLAKVSVPVVKNVRAQDVAATIAGMRQRIEAAYADEHFKNAKAYGVNVELNLTQEKAIYEFFCDDGAANKTPIGTVTKSKK